MTDLPPTPQENIDVNSPQSISLCEAKNPGSFFSETANLPVTPDDTGNLQNTPSDTRFKPGVSGNPKGRPKGARSKLTESFISTVLKDFNEHGAETLERLRRHDPAFYLKMIAVLLPKKLIERSELGYGVDLAELSYEEAGELIEAIKKRRTIEKAIEYHELQ